MIRVKKRLNDRGKPKIFVKNFKGQVTIFIIIAILVVALGVLIYLFYPKIFPKTTNETTNPSAFIQECMQEEIQDTINTISLQGGDYVVNESDGYFYKDKSDSQGNYAKYLCYSSDSFVPCINQEPFLKEHIESEVLRIISPDIENCFNSLVKSYENKGYTVTLEKGNVKFKILPSLISTNFNRTLILVKGDENQRYENFNINLNSNLYDILNVVENILTWEINVGNSVSEAYMYDNPYLRIEKHKKSDDIKVYALTDINTGEVFRFAVRSFASPAGLA